MSRSIKSLKKLRSMVGHKVKVCTLDNVKGVCLVTEDVAGDICLISKDKALSETTYFWDINEGDQKRLKDCTADYVAGHFCCYEYQLTGELKWVTSSVPHKKPAKKKSEKTVVETKEDALRPLSIKQLKEHMPCHALLKDGQVAYVEYDTGTPTVYMKKLCGEHGWPTKQKEGYKYGWYLNDVEDFEDVFEVSEPSQQEILKEILETIKEIKNEIAKR